MASDAEDKDRQRFERSVTGKEARKVRARRDEDRSVFYFLGMIGLIGWTVALPAVIGVAIGWWLDRHYPADLSWTLTCLVIGAALGCASGWYWVKKESNRE